jgi:hypothetical protein
MVLRWIFKRLAHARQATGLWGYLAGRDQNRSRIELERTRVAGTKDLIQHLPHGAVYREGTPDGWREIQMPPVSQPSMLVLPVQPHVTAKEFSEPTELPHSPTALSHGEESDLPANPPLINP